MNPKDNHLKALRRRHSLSSRPPSDRDFEIIAEDFRLDEWFAFTVRVTTRRNKSAAVASLVASLTLLATSVILLVQAVRTHSFFYALIGSFVGYSVLRDGKDNLRELRRIFRSPDL